MASSIDTNDHRVYPTQEDELRAKESTAENLKKIIEDEFLEAFRRIPKEKEQKIYQQARSIVDTFNTLMSVSRIQPYEKQEKLMYGLKKLLKEQINVIEAQRIYAIKINPDTTYQEK